MAPSEGHTPLIKRWQRRCWVLCAYCCLVSPAAAAEPEPTVRLDLTFEAPADCASVDAFKRQVRRRSERIRWVNGRPQTATANVTLTRVATGVHVRLAWARDAGETTIREFSAPNCEEASDAAALIIVITFDPTAPSGDVADAGELESRDTTRSAAGKPSDSSDAGKPSDEQTLGPPREGDETQALDIPETDAGALVNDTRERPVRRWGFSASALLEAMSGLAPAPMEGFGASAGVSWGQGVLHPELRFAFLHYPQLRYPAAGGDSHFELDLARLLACPVRLGARQYALSPCLSVVGGRLQASGHNTENPQSHRRPLWLLGGSLVARFRPTSVLLVMGDVTAGVPLVRDRFQFSPQEFHQVSKLVLSGGLALGIEFP